MKMNVSIRNICLLSFVIMLAACSGSKHRYLQVPEGVAQHDTLYQKTLSEYRLQPNDILYVRVLTEKVEFANMFDLSPTQQVSTNMTGQYFYIMGYPVDLTGNIEMPVVGKIHVAGSTVQESEKIIHEKISKVVYDVQIFVRLVSFRVNIVGEVKSPGEYNIYRDRANIMQALSLAGDMNYYGNRREIMVYRTTEAGTIPYTIDLTKRNALSSPVFYLQPNDMVYVQPLPRTVFRVTVSDMVTYISAISSSLALIVAIVSLTK